MVDWQKFREWLMSYFLAIIMFFFVVLLIVVMTASQIEWSEKRERFNTCDSSHSGCDVYRCWANETADGDGVDTYLLQEQNCLLKEGLKHD